MRIKKPYNTTELLSILNIDDFDFFIIIAIGSHSFLHSDIENIYNEKKETYYDLFKNSSYYNHPYILSLSASNYKGIQQFCGIYIDEKNSLKNDVTLKLIKKGYKYVYNYIKNKQQIDIYDFRDGFLQYISKNSFDSTISSFSYFSIGIYICSILNKMICCDSFYIKLLSDSFNQVFTKVDPFSLESPTENINIDKFINKYIDLGINKKSFKLPLNDFITSIGKVNQKNLSNNVLVNYSDDEINILSRSTKFFKGISKLAYILNFNNIDFIDLQNITNITHEKLNILLSLSNLTVNDLDLNEQDFEDVLGSYIMINALIEDYKSIKRNYLINSYEDTLLELHDLKNTYQQKINILQDNEIIEKRRISNLEDRLNKLNDYCSNLEKKLKQKDEIISKLENKVDSLKSDNSLLQDHLNNYKNIFNNTNLLNLDINHIANYINSKKCIIIGGDKNWQNNLKTYLPDCKFLSVDDLNRKFDFIKQTDKIFFNTYINSHSMFNKVKSVVSKSNAILFYCIPSTNIELTLKDIYLKLNNYDN